MAQRLVRRVCPDCKETYTPTKDELEQLQTALKGLPTSLYNPTDKLKLTRGKGCDKCLGYGFRGRIPLIEQLPMTAAMEDLISTAGIQTTRHAIQALAVKEGMVTLLQDGLLKALAGQTTVEEVYRLVEST
jgi:type II secretory ATPase GspE/PulE/Tfp pilus assembly ATPase PilB-like protein